MFKHIPYIRNSFVASLIFSVGSVLLITMSIWAFFNIETQKKKVMRNVVLGTDRLSNTIRLGTHYAMMMNSRDDINQIIHNISRQKAIASIRIYNKNGYIKYANTLSDIDMKTNIRDEACHICHERTPPLDVLNLNQRMRIFERVGEGRFLGILSPIRNEKGCTSGTCHIHPRDKKILGLLDLVISLKDTDKEIVNAQREGVVLTMTLFILTSGMIFVFVLHFVNRPIKKLIRWSHKIAGGEYDIELKGFRDDEIGGLARAMVDMGKKIGHHQRELHRQRDNYQKLFEQVPCLITVQDKNYKLMNYNREFRELFNPVPGDFCFHAYKGRVKRCDPCPVEKTFQDGTSHYAEEIGKNKDGTLRHWIVRTSPIHDENGNIIAAMEISHDITERRHLELALEKSEEKYHAFFSNIPNPVFVLDMKAFSILDCNKSVKAVYGYDQSEIINRSFLDFFDQSKREYFANEIRNGKMLSRVSHFDKSGGILFVNIRISPTEYSGIEVYLITTSDITKRLETEQQLVQASKMATLGEMATGMAHELNQPLSVIKTVSSFYMGKIEKKIPMDINILNSMLLKVDKNVDRATKIINHMRQFARKSEMKLVPTDVNHVIKSTFEIFHQQLKVRGIELKWELKDGIPLISGNSSRLEQVFINLLANARDAIEEKGSMRLKQGFEKRILVKTYGEGNNVVCEIRDFGTGISEGIIQKIFDPFYTTKEVGKGTGLGLSISYGIVKECHGAISAVSHPDGASFILTFPVLEVRS